MASPTEDPREILLRKFAGDKFLAHKILFSHRRKNSSPEFHAELLRLFYSSARYVALEAFRGAAKSTIMEEYILLEVLFREFKYPIILGNSFGRACERLATIKQELISNDALLELFGDQVGGTWAEDEIVLINGAKIQAFGARQSLRGAKHNDQRPDLAAVDDLEDEEMVATEDARRKLRRWFVGALLPALDPTTGKVRMVGTPLHPKALVEEKCNDPAWLSRKFPICFTGDEGHEVSSWPDRFPMDYIERMRREYAAEGSMTEFEQEYMCRSEDAAAKPFQASMIKVEAAPAQWLPREAFVDPARTTDTKKSARTGYAVWSWMGNKLIVWDAYGKFHKPSEIIDECFKLDTDHSLVHLGVERDGLEEFLMQPLRTAQIERGHPLPLRSMKAPRDKNAFITSLQPFYTAGEVIHVSVLTDLVSELLSFPTGRVDVINALAYALRMRGGKPVYDDFSFHHVHPELAISQRHDRYLVLSSRPAMTAGVLMQYIDGAVRIYESWVENAPPMEALEQLMQKGIMAGGKLTVVAPIEQFDKYLGNGFMAACKRLGVVPLRCGSSMKAQGGLKHWLTKTVKGQQALQTSLNARWVLNGLARGYAYELTDSGTLSDRPRDDVYQLVMETVEAFVAWFDIFRPENSDSSGQRHYATTDTGRQYLTTRPR